MNYHLFVQSPSSLAALEFARAKIQAGEKISQVYFYEQGVSQALQFGEQWRDLIRQADVLKVCQKYVEQYQILVPKGFVMRGLVDFFAHHWQDQGELVQFPSLQD